MSCWVVIYEWGYVFVGVCFMLIIVKCGMYFYMICDVQFDLLGGLILQNLLDVDVFVENGVWEVSCLFVDYMILQCECCCVYLNFVQEMINFVCVFGVMCLVCLVVLIWLCWLLFCGLDVQVMGLVVWIDDGYF